MDLGSFLLGACVTYLVMLFLWHIDSTTVHRQWMGICDRYDQLVKKLADALEEKRKEDDADWWKNN